MPDDLAPAETRRPFALAATLFDTIADGFCVVERVPGEPADFRYVSTNAAFERQSGLPDPAGRTLRELVPSVDEAVIEAYARVAASGPAETLATYVPGLRRWFEVAAAATGEPGRIAVLFRDVTVRKEAERVLRDSEDRQSFLLRFSDALRAAPHDALVARAAELLADQLDLDLCYIVTMDPERDRADVLHQVNRGGFPPIPAVLRLSDYPEAFRQTLDRTLVFDDLATDAALSDLDRRNVTAMRFGALVAAPLHRGAANPIWGVVAVTAGPRRWTRAEVALVEEVSERSWWAIERAQVEHALRDSERRFRALFETMGQGYAACEIVRDAAGRAIDYRMTELNPALERLTGVPVEAARGRTVREAFGVEDWWIETADRIVRQGTPERVEHEVATLGRVYQMDFTPLGGDRFTALYEDITERKRTEQVLRDAEVRQRFLLRLSDALSPLAEPEAIKNAATQVLGEHLGVLRAQYWEADEAAEHLESSGGYADGVAPVTARVRMDDFGAYVKDSYRAGTIMAVPDVAADPRVTPEELAAYDALGFRAWAGVPLVKGGRLVAALGLHHAIRRDWTALEIELTRETAERTWAAVERARAEAAVHASERRLRALVEGVPQLVWRAVAEGQWTWSSPQWTGYTGQPGDESLGMGWLDKVHPDDREAATAAWCGAAAQGGFEARYRVRRASDDAYRWFQTSAVPVRDERGGIVEWLGASTDVDDLRQLQERQGVMVAELQHRTRNLITVVRAVSQETLRTSATLGDFRERFNERLLALSRVQGLLSHLSAGARVTFGELLRSELMALGAPAERTTLDGPDDVKLRSATVQTFALALHELATNALKYGAFATAAGTLTVRWTVGTRPDSAVRLHVDWRERGVDVAGAAPSDGGYGRELIEQALPYQLGAATTYELTPDGVHCTIDVPTAAPAG